jgi:hypothetical protein
MKINKNFGNRIVFTFEEEEESSDDEVEVEEADGYENYQKGIDSYIEFLKEDDDLEESIIKEFESDDEYKRDYFYLKTIPRYFNLIKNEVIKEKSFK